MEGGGSLERIEALGQQLIGRGILVPAVQSELQKYKTRREELLEPVSSLDPAYCQYGVHCVS